MSESRDSVVECRNVSRRYSRSKRGQKLGLSRFLGEDGDGNTVDALSDVSLRVNDGEIVGVSGRSGSGKSTLLHLMAGLDVPTSGAVLIGGKDTSKMSERERAKLRLDNVGIVFQRFRLLPSLTARSNVAMPLVEKGVSKKERRRRAESLLEDVGLGERMSHKPGELSGGEQQRVAIARAIVPDPRVV
ncbi:MAG: ABC transporter ATP-binding protein, partial [Halobacteria archaeon]|nr:ABC transporter ATP-binding protein [Halobacteria archaeon]